MSESAYGTPLLIRDGKEPLPLARVSLSTQVDGEKYDEEFIQKLAFKHPEALPISEIDRAFSNLVPVCMELNTPAGPLDALYVTPTGRLVIAEAKLWRNPEARRKVVSQILDYAKEFSLWDYEDLQRALSSKLKRKGNVLFSLVEEKFPGTDEARFVDEVQKTLKNGRFLLLIIGDGIREGAGAIAEFLSDVGSLEFTFGLIELALYRGPEGANLLVQPRVIARTVVVNRTVVELAPGLQIIEEEDTADGHEKPLTKSELFYLEFWKELTSELNLDDPGQPVPNTTKTTNLYLAMPPSGQSSWISAYFAKSRQITGVYLTFLRGPFADIAFERLVADREAIDEELGIPVEWDADPETQKYVIRNVSTENWDDSRREEMKAYLSDTLNRFVNVFRPRLESIASDMKS
jgi:hypothetical protein